MVTSDWDREFARWKSQKKSKEVKKVPEKTIKETEKEVLDRVFQRISVEEHKHPELTKVIKMLIWLIPLFLIGFILYSNFIASHEFIYSYDLGSEQDINKPYLSPLNRISEAEEGYRNLTSQLVYFDVPIPRGSDKVLVEARILSSLNETIMLGARNKEEWSYLNKEVYNNFLEILNLQKNITRLNQNMPEVSSISEVPQGSTIATNLKLPLIAKKQDFEIKETTITHYMRESHSFYIYLKDSLDLYVEKQDINWYEGEDLLNVSLFDLEGNLLGNTSISDDGVIDTSKKAQNSQSSSLKIENLEEGVYILELVGNADTIITKITLNTDKIVSNRIFSADSGNYLRNEDLPVTLYTNTNKESLIKFRTYHEPYLQKISLNKLIFPLTNRSLYHTFEASEGEYLITFPKSNVIVESSNYLTFSKENYFQPFEYTLTSLPSKQEDLIGIDYLVTDYIPSKQDQEWRIVSVEFDMKDLYISDGKLSLMFNVPHLAESRNETNTQQVKIDWIKSTIQKDGIFKN